MDLQTVKGEPPLALLSLVDSDMATGLGSECFAVTALARLSAQDRSAGRILVCMNYYSHP